MNAQVQSLITALGQQTEPNSITPEMLANILIVFAGKVHFTEDTITSLASDNARSTSPVAAEIVASIRDILTGHIESLVQKNDLLADVLNTHSHSSSSLSNQEHIIFGIGNAAPGTAAMAVNRENIASGHNAFAEGYGNTASGNQAHAEGNQTRATAPQAHSEGWGTHSTNNGAHAEGDETIASGKYSHAEGEKTQAQADYSHSEGMQNITGGSAYSYNSLTAAEDGAEGTYAHTEGNTNIARGTASHAEGKHNFADGIAAHAEGFNNLTRGTAAHAEGQSTQAIAHATHAAGYHTIAASANQTVIGKYNVPDSESEYAFIVGNGIAENARSNAFAVKWNGDIIVWDNGTRHALTAATLASLTQQIADLRALIYSFHPTNEVETQIDFSTGTFDSEEKYITWLSIDRSISMLQLKGNGSTAVNQSHVSALRLLKGHVLHFNAGENRLIKRILITCSDKYIGSDITVGTEMQSNLVVDNPTTITRVLTTSNSGTHELTVNGEGVTDVYLQNNSTSTSLNLQFTAITIIYKTI